MDCVRRVVTQSLHRSRYAGKGFDYIDVHQETVTLVPQASHMSSKGLNDVTVYSCVLGSDYQDSSKDVTDGH